MMSEKVLLFHDTRRYNEIMAEPDPSKCKALGRQVSPFDPGKWNRAQTEILFRGNFEKFTQNDQLMNLLLQTGDALLVEASPYDKIYGAGLDALSICKSDGSLLMPPVDWPGRDILGFTLMSVRDAIRDYMKI